MAKAEKHAPTVRATQILEGMAASGLGIEKTLKIVRAPVGSNRKNVLKENANSSWWITTGVKYKTFLITSVFDRERSNQQQISAGVDVT